MVESLCCHARLATVELASHRVNFVGRESALIAGSVPYRSVEFSAGRAAARAALLDLGVECTEILAGEEGDPVWPPGLCGSISHSREVAVALVAPCEAFQSLGVDVDDGSSLGSARGTVASKREVELLRSVAWAGDDDEAYRLAFSLKEAVFKCQYPVTRYLTLRFHQVRLLRAGPNGVGVDGWRVPARVAHTLRELSLLVHDRDRSRVACAFLRR